MAKHLQKEFLQFHEAIKLIDGDENKILREKRDLLLSDLRDGLKRIFQAKGKPVPTFTHFNQGSYWMGTGVKPLDGDYDIDIGLRFNFAKGDHLPVDVKTWVLDALTTGNRTVEMKRPCVRVQYHKGGAVDYHVDLAVYCKGASKWDQATYLAKGYPGSAESLKIWEEAEPDRLKEIVNRKFSDAEDERQFERVIRYLKRWKDYQFKTDGNAAPTGIALTALALDWFRVEKSTNYSTYKVEHDDLKALYNFLKNILAQFGTKYTSEGWVTNVVVKLPVRPYNDLFEKMSHKQMAALKAKLETLRDTIQPMLSGTRDVKADAKELRKLFGEDFPTG